jgi:PAS domain-containing protein
MLLQRTIIKEQVLARGHSDVYEKELRGKDGTIFPVELRVFLLRDDAGKVIGIWVLIRDITERKRSEEERERLIRELRASLEKVKMLSGMPPICASCKKIRDDKGYWEQIESYIRDSSEAEFTHSICPECVKKFYPDFKNE